MNCPYDVTNVYDFPPSCYIRICTHIITIPIFTILNPPITFDLILSSGKPSSDFLSIPNKASECAP